MEKMKKIVTILIALVMLIGCSQNNSTELKEQSESVKKDDVQVISQAKMGDYLIQIKTIKYEVQEESLSPYFGLYNGSFTIEVKKNDVVCDSYDISFESETNLYFPKEFNLSFQDYNGDRRDDFALGQRVNSVAMEYQFYTIDGTGKVHQMKIKKRKKNSIITDGKEGYDAKFNLEKGKVVYQEYNQETGKSKTKQARIFL